MAQFFNELFWHILIEVAPFLLAGLLLAGILKVLIPDGFVRRVASAERRAGPVLVSLAGVPLPLCSCSVLPFAVSLKREGASRGSVLSFLAATPQTGVDSIAVSYAFFGLPFALFKVVSAFVSGSLLGLALDRFGRRGGQPGDARAPERAAAGARQSDGHEVLHAHGEHECSGEGCSCSHGDRAVDIDPDQKAGVLTRLARNGRKALGYAFGELLGDFAGALGVGLLLSAAVTVLLPAGALAGLEDQWLYYPAVLLVSMPLYVCATSSVPLAFALVSQGLPPGAALVLLIAGPATNFATLGVALKTLGRGATALYVAGIAVLAIGSGLVFDELLSLQGTAMPGATALVPLNLAVLSAILLPGLVVFHLVRQWLRRLDGWIAARRSRGGHPATGEHGAAATASAHPAPTSARPAPATEHAARPAAPQATPCRGSGGSTRRRGEALPPAAPRPERPW